jgi:hypothetical protein
VNGTFSESIRRGSSKFKWERWIGSFQIVWNLLRKHLSKFFSFSYWFSLFFVQIRKFFTFLKVPISVCLSWKGLMNFTSNKHIISILMRVNGSVRRFLKHKRMMSQNFEKIQLIFLWWECTGVFKMILLLYYGLVKIYEVSTCWVDIQAEHWQEDVL